MVPPARLSGTTPFTIKPREISRCPRRDLYHSRTITPDATGAYNLYLQFTTPDGRHRLHRTDNSVVPWVQWRKSTAIFFTGTAARKPIHPCGGDAGTPGTLKSRSAPGIQPGDNTFLQSSHGEYHVALDGNLHHPSCTMRRSVGDRAPVRTATCGSQRALWNGHCPPPDNQWKLSNAQQAAFSVAVELIRSSVVASSVATSGALRAILGRV